MKQVTTETLIKEGIIEHLENLKGTKYAGSYLINKEDNDSIIKFINSELIDDGNFKIFTLSDNINGDNFIKKLGELSVESLATQEEKSKLLSIQSQYEELDSFNKYLLELLIPEISSYYTNSDDEEFEGIFNFEFEKPIIEDVISNFEEE